MGKTINDNDFKDCLKRGKIKKFSQAHSLIPKELENAKSDLKTALDSLKRKNYKWATIQTYYSMFHTARTLLYSRGYRERSHYCLIIALKTLFVSENLIDIRLIEAMQMAKTLRENADYENEFSKSSAEILAQKAQIFLKQAEKILKL